MRRQVFFISLCAAMSIFVAHAQSPQPIVVQAATPPPVAPAMAPAVESTRDAVSVSESVKLLQEMKAANAETLKKQQAVLDQLDEVQKAAEQIKIFAHRS
jgi:hypothetical protein